MKMVRGLEHLYEDRLRLGFVQPREGSSGPYSTFQYLKEGYKEAGQGLLISKYSDRENGFKTKVGLG